MASIIICDIKKTPRVDNFIRECSQIMQIKGFRLLSAQGVPHLVYYNINQNVPLSEINSLIKMVKAIPIYSQVVSNLQFSQNLRRG